MESDGIQLDFQLVHHFFSDHVRVVSDLRIRNPQTSVDVSRREGIWNFILYFANSNVLRYFHCGRLRRNTKRQAANVLRSIHSFTQTEMLSSAAVIPIPFLSDNYSYLIVDRQSKTAAVVDPSDQMRLGVAKELAWS